jgi:hypothetical protein
VLVRCLRCENENHATRIRVAGDAHERWLLPRACVRCGEVLGRRRGAAGAWPVAPRPPRQQSLRASFKRRRPPIELPALEELERWLSPVSIETARYLVPLLQHLGEAAAGRRLGLTRPQVRARVRRLERAVDRFNDPNTDLRRRRCRACEAPIPLDARRGTYHCADSAACRKAAQRKRDRRKLASRGIFSCQPWAAVPLDGDAASLLDVVLEALARDPRVLGPTVGYDYDTGRVSAIFQVEVRDQSEADAHALAGGILARALEAAGVDHGARGVSIVVGDDPDQLP